MIWLALAVAAVLGVVHVVASHLKFLDVVPRSRLLSAAGGVSVAYVFVHLLPELAELQEHVKAAAGETLAWVDRHVYLLALVSFAGFYGLERLARLSRGAEPGRRQTSGEKSGAGSTPAGVFWIHIASFAVYNALIGYLLLHRDQSGVATMVWFGVAMALHFLVNDHGLYEHHRHRYDRYGRWVLAAAVLVGWALSLLGDVGRAAIGVLLSLLAGGVVLNVIKEELPEERRSRWWAFVAGAAGYSALLLLL